MNKRQTIALAQSAAVEALNGLSDLERQLQKLAGSTDDLRDVESAIGVIRQINWKLSQELEA